MYQIKAKKFVLTCKNVHMHFLRKNKQTNQKKVHPLSFSSFLCVIPTFYNLGTLCMWSYENSQKEKWPVLEKASL